VLRQLSGAAITVGHAGQSPALTFDSVCIVAIESGTAGAAFMTLANQDQTAPADGNASRAEKAT